MLGAIICLFLLCALGSLFFFRETPSDDFSRELILLYDYNEGMNTSDSGWVYESRLDNLTYIASPNNMMIVLRTQYYCDYPLAMDVSSWEISKEVTIGMTLATVVGESFIADYECWECEINNESYLYYDTETGIFVYSSWANDEASRFVTLLEVNMQEFNEYVSQEGVLLSGIFVELAVIIWLIADRLKKSK